MKFKLDVSISNINVFVLIIVVILVIIIIKFMKTKPIEITPKEARKNIEAGLYDYIIDVRSDEEWSEGHLPNSIHMPIGTIVTELPKRIPDKNARILFICKKGIRANAVTVIADKLGYKNIQSMVGNYKEANIQ